MKDRAVRSWVMYDWANSAFATTIMAAVMPIFYADVAGKNLTPATATAYWGYTQSIALAFVFLLSPVLGAIADATRSKRNFLFFFMLMGVIATVAMAGISEGDWLFASVLVILGTLAFSGGNVFYDAFLPELVPEEKQDMVSSKGYAYGYIGGGLLLAVNLAMIQFPHIFLLPDTLTATRLAFVSVGLWWFFFSLPLFRHVRDRDMGGRPARIQPGIVIDGFRRVGRTLRSIRRYPELLKFLIAFCP